ncbi:MAG: RES family NAD+ phosphorylase [Mariprofundaceae bacterium]|nr:RES family NAD+ phosphorylase [Mariprofundaceae bacterium]
MSPSIGRICWQKTARLVPSRFPPILLFERVADSDDYEVLYQLESMTNERIRDEEGDIHLVAPADRIYGAGTTPVMAAFTHPNPAGSRFSAGTFGIYYAGRAIDTAVAEAGYHLGSFYLATREGALQTDMRTYFADVDADLHDIRGMQANLPELYYPDDYSISQAYGAKLKKKNSMGIAYSSVRHPAGECLAILKPVALSPATQGPHYRFDWNGATIANVVAYGS